MQVILAQPRGFCAGVVRAIEIVKRGLQIYGTPVYVLHEIVHNRHVVENLKNQGALFIETLDEVPADAVTIFSAHGVSTAVVELAKERNLKVIDATCPLVTKVHLQGKKYVGQGRTVILVGHAGHPEVEGTMGQIPGPVHLVQTELFHLAPGCFNRNDQIAKEIGVKSGELTFSHWKGKDVGRFVHVEISFVQDLNLNIVNH